MNYEDRKYQVFSLLVGHYAPALSIEQILNMTDAVMRRLFNDNGAKLKVADLPDYLKAGSPNPSMYGIWPA